MSNFNCEHCGTICIDSDRGYVTGCRHYLPDVKPMRGFGMTVDTRVGVPRRWFIDEYGAKRWADNSQQCDV